MKKLSKKALNKSFRNWFYGHLTCFSQEHMQTFGYMCAMLPIIQELYDTNEEQTEKTLTYSTFFNTEPQVGSIVVGITAGMEEARANGEPVDDETINGIRAGLMGPLAGIGDSLVVGTLLPILHDRGLMGTRLGDSIVAYGTWGEICPIIAIALVMSTRKTWVTVVILAAFAIIAVLAAVVPRRLWERGTALTGFVSRNAETNSQMAVRGVMVLLVGLLAVSALFDLDIVLGSFAAGFVLRFIMPHGDQGLERKLNGIGYGFFIPLFFIVSGMGIDPQAVIERPGPLFLFIGMLLLVRALPIYNALRLNPDTREMDPSARATVALYCTMALPLIVAVTSIATTTGAMDTETASVLVAAGGITVLLMPLLATATLALLKKRHER